MPVTIDIGVADLARTRFAISPLGETVRGVRTLADPPANGLNASWIRWAEAQVAAHPLHADLVHALVANRRRITPEFLLPAPNRRAPTIEDQLAALVETRAEDVRASLRRVFGSGRLTAGADELYRRPRRTLRAVAAELRTVHDRLIAPHWPRMRAVLDADIAHRARLLAEGGLRRLFADLHADLRWTDGRITIAEPKPLQKKAFQVTLGPDGLVLVPSVLCWPYVPVKISTTTQTTVTYPARGIGALWQTARPPDSARGAARLLGEPRARILAILRSPASTTDLAVRLGVTPGAVSQHLAVLHAGGLVGRERVGRHVLYLASELGLALLEPDVSNPLAARR